MANAILTGRFIGKTFVQHQTKIIENLQYGKQIDDFLDNKKCQKRPQARKPIFWGLESEKSGNLAPNLENFEKYIKNAPNKLCRMDHTLLQTSS